MAIARGNIVRPTQVNLPLLQLPFEQLVGQMQSYQQDYDTVGSLTSIMPNYLEKDAEWANRYKEYISAISESVTNAFASGDTVKAMRMLNAAKNTLANEWKPGGLAIALQNRYEAYNKGIEQLRKAAEKDPTNLNYLYGANIFQKSIEDLGYDYVSGKYNQIGQPLIFNYTDINKKVLENVNAVDADITEKDILSGYWIQRLKNKGYDQNKIESIWQGIISDPGVAQQLEVNAFGVTRNMTPEQMAETLDNDINTTAEKINKAKESLFNLPVKEQQKLLQEQGLYRGKIDGIAGSMTKEAVNKYNELLDKRLERLAEYQNNPEAYIKQKYVVEPLKNQYQSYFGSEESLLIRPNQVALENLRFQRRKQLQDRAFMLNQRLLESNVRGATYTPTVPTDISGEYTKLYNEAKRNVSTLESDYKKMLNNPTIKSNFNLTGNYEQDASKVQRYLEAYKRSGNDLENFAKNLGIDSKEASQAFNIIQRDGSTIEKQVADLANAKRLIHNAVRNESSIYFETAKDKMKEYYEKYKKPGESIEEFSQALTEASKLDGKDLTDKYSRFVRLELSGIGNVTGRTNLAKLAIEDLNKVSVQKFKEGKVPQTLVRYTATGQSKNYGFGQISDRVKTDISTRNFYGYSDPETGNTDKFKIIGTNKTVKWEDIDIKSVSVVYDNGNYTITAKKKGEDEYISFRSEIPNSHTDVDLNIMQEAAIAINDGNLSNAAKAVRDLEARQGSLLNMDLDIVTPTNQNVDGKELTAKVGDKIVTIDQPYTIVKSEPYAGGGELRLIIFNDFDGTKKYSTVIYDGKTNRIVGKPTLDGVVIRPQENETVSSAFYENSTNALDAYLLYKWSPQLPVQDIYETIPKDLKGLGLDTRLRSTQLPETELFNEEDNE